ncbi:DUF6445 family protein [Streptomyces sp. ID05-04B]|uniref:DUF6445 family protein n=1 Tax=unclassified Streptomyces TaxID=2593676 RepID=UPI000D19EA68|nr:MULTISPECIES: DUF6445 family protein [unclassified Streptomyces]AVV41407.1 hypothetical protein C6376_08105 [Streptomyces sp. P3]MDX5565530.1 DUF6445 family protein [Streptomyces sp. ID05-04B]
MTGGDRIIVVDQFYADPDRTRRLALSHDYRSAAAYNYPGWQSDKMVQSPALIKAFSELIGAAADVDFDSFTFGGFRLATEETGRLANVHADQAADWAGMVYLTPDAPDSAGTGFFRHRATGLECPPTDAQARAAGYGDAFEFEERAIIPDYGVVTAWELVEWVAPVYNRLILFRGCEMYHASLGGCGDSPESARLTHNFFFNEVSSQGFVSLHDGRFRR